MNGSDCNQRGFTLIELLVVIAIISLLSSTVLASLQGARESARNSERRQSLNQIRTAIEMYVNDNGGYPDTGGLGNIYGDPTCTLNHSSDKSTAEWVPGLVSGGYIDSLPKDPIGEDQARGSSENGACYAYSSDGERYVLSAWATVEGGKVSTDDSLYSRAGFRETSLMDDNANYYCDHPNIGDSSSGDYYRYSYTITSNVDCDW